MMVLVVWGCAPLPPPEQSLQPSAIPASVFIEPSPWTTGFASTEELKTRQEVLLHAALYRAALETSVGGLDLFVLAPAVEAEPRNPGIDAAEFQKRVLEALSDVPGKIAWLPVDGGEQGVDLFPGTETKATRLTITITKRDEEQATVYGEAEDRTSGAASSRQGVTAIWDGEAWNVTRHSVRLVW